MQTKRLSLVPFAPEHWRALLQSVAAYEKASGLRMAEGLGALLGSGAMSPVFLAKVQTATTPDPWEFGFASVHIAENLVVGTCGYKGPPQDGIVEIAYGTAPGYQGKGYATEAALALTAQAFADPRVRIVRAHTLAERNASTSVLQKCGFKKIGDVIDPEDGLVWRWERHRSD